MNIYHLEQNDVSGWDTFSDIVVIAKDTPSAKRMHPYGNDIEDQISHVYMSWTGDPAKVKCTCIGVSHETMPRVVCKSFHAG